jgi:hypothetical protein
MSSSVDIQFVARLVADLCAHGLDALDTSRAEFDHPERTVAYPHTGVLLIVLSADGLRSAWLEREIGHALDLCATHPELSIIPLILTAGLESPTALEHLTPLDFSGREYDDALADLLTRVAPEGGVNRTVEEAPSPNGARPAATEPAIGEMDSAPRSGPLSWQQLEELKRARHEGSERQTSVATPPARVESDLHSVLAETEYMLWSSDDDADPDAGVETAAPAEVSQAVPVAADAVQPEPAQPEPAQPEPAQPEPAQPEPPAPSYALEAEAASAPSPAPAPQSAAEVELAGQTPYSLPQGETLAELAAGIAPFTVADEVEPRDMAEPETQVTSSRFLRTDAAPALATPEEVAFTAYHPREVDPRVWQEMLVYIAADTPRALASVAADAETRLASRKGAYRDATARANIPLRRGTVLTIVPDLPGFEFNPASLTVTWEEDAQRHEFRLRAASARPGQATNGSVRVYAGPYLRGEVPISIFVQDPQERVKTPGGYISVFARAYHNIFASYSHTDTEVVGACEAATEALGDRYLRDVTLLRSGDTWNERLLSAIEDADIFQLFWSQKAATSPAVEREWRHALALAATRPGFIRPVYWTGKPYTIPAELSAIHFDRLDLARLGVGHSRSLVGRLLGRG